jgi:hypothetical protein
MRTYDLSLVDLGNRHVLAQLGLQARTFLDESVDTLLARERCRNSTDRLAPTAFD